MTNGSPARLISCDMDHFHPIFKDVKESFKTLIHLVNLKFGCHLWYRKLISWFHIYRLSGKRQIYQTLKDVWMTMWTISDSAILFTVLNGIIMDWWDWWRLSKGTVMFIGTIILNSVLAIYLFFVNIHQAH